MILGKTNLDAQKAAENAANKVLLKEHTKTIEQLLEKINNLPLNDFEETHAYIQNQNGKVCSTYKTSLDGLFYKIRKEFELDYMGRNTEKKCIEIHKTKYHDKIYCYPNNLEITLSHIQFIKGYHLGLSRDGDVCVYMNGDNWGTKSSEVITYLENAIKILEYFMEEYKNLVENLKI